jgi:hypothetical protein
MLLLTLFLLAGGAIVVSTALLWRDVNELATIPALRWGLIGAGCCLYLLAHSLRALRLTIMMNDPRIGLRETLGAHTIAASASLLVPFKLGEVFRVAEVTRLSGSLSRGVLTVWSERMLDLVVITLAMLAAMVFRPGLFPSAASGVLLTLAVIVGTLVLFYVLPENLEGAKLFIIRRYHTPWSINTVRTVDGVQRVIESAPGALRRRWPTLLSLTTFIWVLEIGALGLLLPRDGGVITSTLAATAFFFAQVFPSSMGPLAAILVRVLPDGIVPGAELSAYPIVNYLVFLVLALAIFIAWLPMRLSTGIARVRDAARPGLPTWARERDELEDVS